MAKRVKKDSEESPTVPLPDITGSEKQISWAKRIRDDLVAKLTGANTERCMAALREQTDARFFIDNRDNLEAALLNKKADTDGGDGDSELPPLAGSEKQVAWAGRIRASFWSKLDTSRRKAIEKSVHTQDKASWWIDHRDGLDAAFLEGSGGTVDKGIKLPALDGTDKQISWAERIRTAFMKTVTPDELKAWGKTIKRLKEATFWIDHREDVREGIQSEVAEPGSTTKLRKERYSSNWE